MIFDYIIITAPSAAAAEIYSIQIAHSLGQTNTAKIVCIADPPQRLGSGGGTLNALSYISDDDQIHSKKVAIIHSGGESRRAPLHSITGKCWASFNAISSSDEIASPILVLIEELREFCKDIEGGFFIVASSDVLLDIIRADVIIPTDCFTVISVPELMTTAKNHGVIICNIPKEDTKTAVTVIVSKYMQKPPISTMREESAQISFINESDEDYVLIDTGVVIATGTAFKAFLILIRDPILSFTCFGNNPAQERMQEESTNLKFELYSDTLLCLTYYQDTPDFVSYLNRLKYIPPNIDSLYEKALKNIWSTLRYIPLYTVVIKTGKFAHLGTSAELLDLITYSPNSIVTNTKLGFFSSKLGFQKSVRSCVLGGIRATGVPVDSNRVHRRGVVINSILEPTIKIDHGSLVEHCVLSGQTKIGSRSIVSHVYGDLGRDLVVPDATMVQQLPVVVDGCLLTVFLILGLTDDVKGMSTLCGRPMEQYLELHGVSTSDLWPSSTTNTTSDTSLWTAKLFMAVDSRSIGNNSERLEELCWMLDDSKTVSNRWKQSVRYSLADLLHMGDASLMFLLRNHISSFVKLQIATDFSYMTSPMMSFLYLTIASTSIVHSSLADLAESKWSVFSSLLLQSLLHAMHGGEEEKNVVEDAITNKKQATDFAAFLLNSDINMKSNYLLVLTLCRRHSTVHEISSICIILLQKRSIWKLEKFPRLLFILAWLITDIVFSTPDRDSIYNELLDFMCMVDPQGVYTKDVIQVSAEQLEKLAQRVIFLQIQYSLESNQFIKEYNSHNISNRESNNRDQGLNKGNMIVVTAPVRIDIAGGWSDTPPITYEASGAVLNVAVKINNIHPICVISRNIDENVVRLKTYRSDGSIVVVHEQVECSSWSDVHNLVTIQDPTEPCAILKAVLIVLGFASNIAIYRQKQHDTSLSWGAFLGEYGGGFEVCCFSGLPAGSGMGGSSIIAAALLAAVAKLWRREILNTRVLIEFVTGVEQVLTTGGGWQDQIGGVLGGFKLGRSLNGLPLRVEIEQIATNAVFDRLFNERVCVIYTGSQRLAKNTLINALRAFSLNPFVNAPDSTVCQLRTEAEQCAQLMREALVHSIDIDEIHLLIDKLGAYISRYWQLKKEMASGSEPPDIHSLLAHLAHHCVGLSLCGAGAGGYAVCILSRSSNRLHLQKAMDRFVPESTYTHHMELVISSVEVDNAGLNVEVISNAGQGESIESFFAKHSLHC